LTIRSSTSSSASSSKRGVGRPAGAKFQRLGYQPEYGRKRGHEDWTQAHAAFGLHGFPQGHASFEELLGELEPLRFPGEWPTESEAA
jgi:hypothetical protein